MSSYLTKVGNNLHPRVQIGNIYFQSYLSISVSLCCMCGANLSTDLMQGPMGKIMPYLTWFCVYMIIRMKPAKNQGLKTLIFFLTYPFLVFVGIVSKIVVVLDLCGNFMNKNKLMTANQLRTEWNNPNRM